jgi:two-component system, NarL family, sensor histidine kinase UhpB
MDEAVTQQAGGLFLASHVVHANRPPTHDPGEIVRRELARELHDTVIQPLTALLMSISQVECRLTSPACVEAPLAVWRGLAQEALESLRGSLAGLQTSALAANDLPGTLRDVLAPQLKTRGLRLNVKCHGWPTNLPLTWASNLYLVMREAVMNAEKHAHASAVTVEMQGDAEGLVISIADNGIGFPRPDLTGKRPDQPGSGLGISCMRDRVAALGGRMDLVEAAGRGVRIEITLPHSPCVEGTTGSAAGDVAPYGAQPQPMLRPSIH